MFRVVDGEVESLTSPFSNRETGRNVEDIVREIPGRDYAKMRQGPHVPLNRAFPPPGGFV